jgi:hypothetical protein
LLVLRFRSWLALMTLLCIAGAFLWQPYSLFLLPMAVANVLLLSLRDAADMSQPAVQQRAKLICGAVLVVYVPACLVAVWIAGLFFPFGLAVLFIPALPLMKVQEIFEAMAGRSPAFGLGRYNTDRYKRSVQDIIAEENRRPLPKWSENKRRVQKGDYPDTNANVKKTKLSQTGNMMLVTAAFGWMWLAYYGTIYSGSFEAAPAVGDVALYGYVLCVVLMMFVYDRRGRKDQRPDYFLPLKYLTQALSFLIIPAIVVFPTVYGVAHVLHETTKSTTAIESVYAPTGVEGEVAYSYFGTTRPKTVPVTPDMNRWHGTD